jgi:hypothetical protein
MQDCIDTPNGRGDNHGGGKPETLGFALKTDCELEFVGQWLTTHKALESTGGLQKWTLAL